MSFSVWKLLFIYCFAVCVCAAILIAYPLFMGAQSRVVGGFILVGVPTALYWYIRSKLPEESALAVYALVGFVIWLVSLSYATIIGDILLRIALGPS